MAQFTNKDYENAVSAATNPDKSNSERPRLGFFKLANDGDEALIRINIGDVSELNGVTLHKAAFGEKFEGLPNPYGGVDCLNVFGAKQDQCPFCTAAANGDKVISKATKKLFVQMLVRYKDAASGAFSETEAVVWERPYGFYKDLLVFLKNGSLRDSLLTITRVGSGQGLRYILNYAPEKIYNPSLIPADFSAFDGVDPSRFYFKKTAEEMQEFVDTRHFSKPVSSAPAESAAPVHKETQATSAPVDVPYKKETDPFAQAEVNPFTTQTAEPAKVEEKPAAEAQPQRNFNWNW